MISPDTVSKSPILRHSGPRNGNIKQSICNQRNMIWWAQRNASTYSISLKSVFEIWNIRIRWPMRGLKRTMSPSNQDHAKGHSSRISAVDAMAWKFENATIVPLSVCFNRILEVRWWWRNVSREVVAAAGGTATCIFNLDFWKSFDFDEEEGFSNDGGTDEAVCLCLCFFFFVDDWGVVSFFLELDIRRHKNFLIALSMKS